MRKKYHISRIIVYGSYIRKDLNEGSDIDMVVVGDFKEKFIKRAAMLLDLTDLPIEPICYTENEFQDLIQSKNPFIQEVIEEGIEI